MPSNRRFGSCLKQIMERHEMSIAETARRMRLKSSTSLARILHDEASLKTTQKFYQALLALDPLPFTAEEMRRLEQALGVDLLGPERYDAFRQLDRIVFPGPAAAAPPRLKVTVHAGSGLPEKLSAQRLMEYLSACPDIQLTMTGCCSEALVNTLASLLREGAPQKKRNFVHYLHDAFRSSARLVKMISVIRPLLPYPTYNAYICDSRVLPDETADIYEGNNLLCQATDASGARRMFHCVMVGPEDFFLTEYHDPAVFSFQLAMLRQIQPYLSPVKDLFPAHATPEDYVAYTENYRRLEHARPIYSVIPDVPLNFIQVDILLAVLQDAARENEFAASPEFRALLSQLYVIQDQRAHNMFEKRQVSHYIFSYPAMAEFARTGMQSDHFFAMRPYTPAERRQILQTLRDNMAGNPFFHLYFAKDDALSFQMEITCYEGLGVLMLNADTSYTLGDDLSETLITEENFTNLFISYFQEELIPNHVHSPKESLALMDQLLFALPRE